MLTDRQKKIMVAIVEAYTENNLAEPIGSSTLSKHEDLQVSTATLRNEMSSLEEMGYLEKTHTSSGRIPTEKGYRLYVDELMTIDTLTEELKDQVEFYFENTKASFISSLEHLIKGVIDNREFNYGAVLLEKVAYNSVIKKIDFTYLRNHKGIFLVVTDQGLVLYREASIPEGINISSIEKTIDYLSEKLNGVLLNDFKHAKLDDIKSDDFFNYISNADAVLEVCIRNIRKLVDDKRKIIGQYNILNHPDFGDAAIALDYIECLKNNSIYQIVEFDNGPLPVIASTDANTFAVKIGSEHKIPGLEKCSSITAYFQGKKGTGAITIYGPLRMKYRYVISLLKGIAENIK